MTGKKILCKGCSENITKKHFAIKCSGECGQWFHKKCSKLSDKEFKIYSGEHSEEKWLCENCSQEDDNSDSDEEKFIRTPKTSETMNSRCSDSAINEILKQLHQMNSKFSKFEESINHNSAILADMQKSMNFMKQENKPLRKENESLKARVLVLEEEVISVKQNVGRDEYKERANNAIVVGLLSETIAEPKDSILKIFRRVKLPAQQDDFECKNKNSNVLFKE